MSASAGHAMTKDPCASAHPLKRGQFIASKSIHNGTIRKKPKTIEPNPVKISLFISWYYLGMMRLRSFLVSNRRCALAPNYRTRLFLSQVRANPLQFVLLDCCPRFRPVRGRSVHNPNLRYVRFDGDTPVAESSLTVRPTWASCATF